MLRKLWSVGPRGWIELIEAQWWILHAQMTLRRRPLGMLAAGAGQPANPGQPPLSSDSSRKQSVIRAIDRVATFGFWRPLCLARSLALHRMLERHRVPGSVIRVGVRRDGSSLEAHAWVEIDGEIIGDDPSHVHRYQRVDDLSVLPLRFG